VQEKKCFRGNARGTNLENAAMQASLASFAAKTDARDHASCVACICLLRIFASKPCGEFVQSTCEVLVRLDPSRLFCLLLAGNRTAHDMAAPSQGPPPQQLAMQTTLPGSCPPPHAVELERGTQVMGPPKHHFDAITLPSQPQRGSSLTSSRQCGATPFLEVDSGRRQRDLVERPPLKVVSVV
jgi:hypothetical protein